MNEKGYNQQREEILQEELPTTENDIVYYYDSEEEVEDDQGEEKGMEQNQSNTAANFREIHISKFLKLPKRCKKGIKVSRIEREREGGGNKAKKVEEKELNTIKRAKEAKKVAKDLKAI